MGVGGLTLPGGDPVVAQVLKHGAVYCIGDRRGGRVKIGWSRDPLLRLKQLQTASDMPLRLLSWFPGTRAVEASLHADNAEFHVHGEWFDDVDGIITSTSDDMLALFQRGGIAL